MEKLEKIAKVIDHTNINPKAKKDDILKTCQEAKRYGFRGVCVRLEWVKLVAKELKGTTIKTIALIDPPIGDSPHKKRIKMCKKAKKDGADELDVVMNIVDAKKGRWDKILKDLKEICKILPTKVIIGSGYLTDDEIIKASQICEKAGAICVKTATEKDPLEHRELKEKFYHLNLMKKGAPNLLIKASGGIRTLKDLKNALKAGADIVGTSSGAKIIAEFLKLKR
jgi:deoxyribose-phosphate aldolase